MLSVNRFDVLPSTRILLIVAASQPSTEKPSKLPRALLHRLEKAEDFPLSALEAVTQLRQLLDETERIAVRSAREKGATWDDLAYALGVTRQAVFYRYRSREHRPKANPAIKPIDLEVKPVDVEQPKPA